MFVKTAIIALVGALSVSANEVSHLLTRSEHSSVLARQITASQIPSACQSQCTSALTIYQACTTGDTNGCLAVCQPSNYSNFVSCLQCVLTNTPGVTATEITSLNSVLGQLGTACSAAGQAVSSTSLVASTGAASGSASASRTSGASASAISASASSVTGSSARPTSSGLAASVSSVINSASGVAASASSSRAAADSVAQLPQGLHMTALGLVGLVAGAAYIL